MSNSTRRKKINSKSNVRLIPKYNKYLETLGQLILQNTKPKNIELLKSIQHNKPHFKNFNIENIVNKNPYITPEIISKTICFTALIYKNEAVFKFIKTHFMPSLDIRKHNDYILSMIGPFFPEAEIVGGVGEELMIPSRQSNNTTRSNKKKMQMFTPWFFIISLLSFIWVSFISYNQLLFIQTEMENNAAFALVKDITSAAFTCDFNNIYLTEEERSIFKVLRYSNILDKRALDAIEKTLKLQKCVSDPTKVFETEVFNQNIRTGEKSTSYQKQILNIKTNIVPNELENKEVITNSLALVPASSAAMLVPTETMTKYIANYNSKIYNNIESKIAKDMDSIRKNGNIDPGVLIKYFKNMQNMNVRDFKAYFEETPGTGAGADADYIIPNLTDLNNILGIFGGNQDSLFEIFIKGFAGMNIIEVTHADFKKRMLSIHTELIIKSAQTNEYIENLIIDSSSLISLLISFKTILCWFISISLIFGSASYKMTQYIREQMKRKPQSQNLLENMENNDNMENKENNKKKKSNKQKLLKETE